MLSLSAHRVAELLGITPTELASVIGLARKPLAADTEASTVDAALDSIVRIMTAAIEMAGSEERGVLWFKRHPIPSWAGKTAYELVREGKADKVLTYLEAVRSGVYA